MLSEARQHLPSGQCMPYADHVQIVRLALEEATFRERVDHYSGALSVHLAPSLCLFLSSLPR